MSDIPDQQPDVSALDTLLRFEDLKRANVVNSWKVLREWQRDERIKFPKGKLLAPNTRRWSKKEIDEWLKNRPVEPDEQMRTQRSNSASKAAETRRKHREQSEMTP